MFKVKDGIRFKNVQNITPGSNGFWFGDRVWINHTAGNYDGYNENIRLVNANNNVATIAFSASGESGTPTTSILGYGSYMERRYSNTWEDRLYSGYVEARGSYRAPIFYDSNNTGYYIDPNSSAVLRQLRIDYPDTSLYIGNGDTSRAYSDGSYRSGISITNLYPHIDINGSGGTNSTHGAVLSFTGTLSAGGYRRFGIGVANYDPSIISIGYADNQQNPHYGVGGSGWSQWWLDTSGNNFVTGSSRAPMFYDQNDTSYYVDPNGNTRLYNISDHLTFFRNQTSSIAVENQSSFCRIAYNELRFYEWDVGGDMFTLNGNFGQFANSVRAPIFYDSNNTGYYVDPASGSNLNQLTVSGVALEVTTTIDATGLDESTFYPVTMSLSSSRRTRMCIDVGLNSGSTPSWATHGGGFTLQLEWSSIGSGWGTTSIQRKVEVYSEGWISSGNAAGSIGQLSQSSTEYVYVRGGGKYHFRCTNGVVPVLRTSNYTINSQTIGPISGVTSLGDPWTASTTHQRLYPFYVVAGNQIQSPIYYDSADTNYYVRPGSTTQSARFRQFVQIGDSSSYSTNSGTWGARLNVTDDIHAKIEVGQDANGMLSHWYAHTGQSSIKFGTSSSHDVEFQRGGTTQLALYSGYAQANNQMRAPIYYDSADTNYYVDANSTSVLNNVNVAGTIQHTGGNGAIRLYGNLHIDSYNGYDIYLNYYGSRRTRVYVGTSEKFRVDTDGIVYAYDQFRTPIMYDNNDTGYYVNPNATSRVNIIQCSNADFYGPSYFYSNLGSYLGSLNSPALQVYSTSGNSAFMSFHRGGYYAVNLGLDADNVFRLGGWSAAADRMAIDMSGNLTMAGNVTAYSDIRVKSNIEVISNALNKVLAIRGVTFNRIDEGSNPDIRQAGVIAQEVEAVLPEVVSENAAGIKNVAYGNMVGLLIEAIKEQDEKITRLEALVEKLLEK